MKKKKDTPTLAKFRLAIFRQGLKKVDIAAKMDITDGHLVNILAGRNELTETKRAELNKILNTNI